MRIVTIERLSKVGEFDVSVSRNGSQWNCIYSNRDKAMCKIIARAFEEVGYKYEDLTESIIKFTNLTHDKTQKNSIENK